MTNKEIMAESLRLVDELDIALSKARLEINANALLRAADIRTKKPTDFDASSKILEKAFSQDEYLAQEIRFFECSRNELKKVSNDEKLRGLLFSSR